MTYKCVICADETGAIYAQSYVDRLQLCSWCFSKSVDVVFEESYEDGYDARLQKTIEERASRLGCSVEEAWQSLPAVPPSEEAARETANRLGKTIGSLYEEALERICVKAKKMKFGNK